MKKHDWKIVNARLVDGLGRPAREGEIAWSGDRLEAVGNLVSGPADKVIDAAGAFVAPGFIDLHAHGGPGPQENFLRSGVTLMVSGNCGFSEGDFEETAAACPGACGPDMAFLAGHNTVRLAVMGNSNRAPGDREMSEMKKRLAGMMKAGAAGLSSGLAYVPGNYARPGEVSELARAAAEFGGYYASHMRNEAAGLLDSVAECAAVGRESGLPVHLSHLKVVGLRNHGRSRELIALLDQLHGSGLDITQDQYPYTASCGRIQLLLPQWAQEGGPADVRRRLENRDDRTRIVESLLERWQDYYGNDGNRVVVSRSPDDSLVGLGIGEISERAGRGPGPVALAETVLEIIGRFPGQTEVYCVYHGMSEDDLAAIMRHPRTSVGSDGWSPRTETEKPHPRSYGTFPRVLGRYAREKGIFSIEEAVRRMTSLPASRLGMADRGVLAEGAVASLVVFDPDRVIDRADFTDSRLYPEGIDRVFVNGAAVVEGGVFTGALPGRFVPRAS